MFLDNIGEKLQEYRQELSLSYAEAQELSGLKTETIQNIEEGVIQPSVLAVHALCYAYGLPMSMLEERLSEAEENIAITHNGDEQLYQYLLYAHAVQQELDNINIPEIADL